MPVNAHWECPHCGNKQTMERLNSYSTVRVVTYETNPEDLPVDAPEDHTTWTLLKCTVCEMPTLEQSIERVLPDDEWAHLREPMVEVKVVYPTTRLSTDSLPRVVREAYEKASMLQHIEPSSCAMWAARTLEVVCTDKGATGDKLVHQINRLVQLEGIPLVFATMAHQLRLVRNLGTHVDPEDVVKREDIPVIMDFLDAILEYVYIAPAKVAALQVRLGKASPTIQ